MLFTTLFAASALVGTGFAKNHKVAVGSKNGNLTFSPDSIDADKGDTVTFKFWPKNHSVAQSSFDAPCQPLKNTGFWSGFVPTSDTSNVANETFVYEVTNASAPVWFYCSQAKHCQSGMVGVINPPKTGDRTLAAYKNASQSAANNVSPSSAAGFGGKISQNGASGSGSSSSSSGAAASRTSSPAQSTGGAAQLAGSATFAGLAGLFAFVLV